MIIRQRDRLGRYAEETSPPDPETFWSRTTPEPNTGCWLWTGKGGRYGQVSVKDRPILAHRRAWEFAMGPIPKGAYICHRCDVPGCVNPDHLFLGTAKQNSEDMSRKGRAIHGERHHNAKLTEAVVAVVKLERNRGVSYSELSRRLGISRSALRSAVNGNTWRKAAALRGKP